MRCRAQEWLSSVLPGRELSLPWLCQLCTWCFTILMVSLTSENGPPCLLLVCPSWFWEQVGTLG